METMRETINNLEQAIYEIDRLTRENEVLKAKVQTLDSVMLLFTSQPNIPRIGMSPSILHSLDKHVNLLKQQEELKNQYNEKTSVKDGSNNISE